MIIILSLTLEKKTSEHHIPIIPVDAEADAEALHKLPNETDPH